MATPLVECARTLSEIGMPAFAVSLLDCIYNPVGQPRFIQWLAQKLWLETYKELICAPVLLCAPHVDFKCPPDTATDKASSEPNSEPDQLSVGGACAETYM